MHFLCGNNNLLNHISRHVTENSFPPNLEFTKRYPLNQDVIEEFKMNLASNMLSNDYCALIGLPGPASKNLTAPSVSKHLKDMVTYLTNKNTALRISDFDENGEFALFVFPPCDFTNEYLQTTLPADNKVVLSLTASCHVLIVVMAK